MTEAGAGAGHRVRAFERLWLRRLAQGCDMAGLAVQIRVEEVPVVLRVRVSAYSLKCRAEYG
jgi:hypothetical protein